jgi:hypothetical protein
MKGTKQQRPRRSKRKGEDMFDGKVERRNTKNEEQKGLGEMNSSAIGLKRIDCTVCRDLCSAQEPGRTTYLVICFICHARCQQCMECPQRHSSDVECSCKLTGCGPNIGVGHEI